MATCIVDLDGTLSKYPGSDFRSLYSKMSDFYKLTNDIKLSAKQSAELMVNRLNKSEIDTLISNIKLLRDGYGKMIILSLNTKIVTETYLNELGIDTYFDLENSYFRDNIPGTKKERIWPTIMEKYGNIVYIEDDKDTINKLKEVSVNINLKVTTFKNDGSIVINTISEEHIKKIHFIHVDNCWLGNIDLTKI